MMTLTQDLGRFVADISFERLPQGAADVARTGFIDCIATMIAGAGDPAPQLLRKALNPAGGDATLYFTGERCPAPEAAWINGTAGHALDYDDVASLRGHPSTVLVPAILAEGEALGASGRDMLAAYVAGYEAWAELAWRDPGHHHAGRSAHSGLMSARLAELGFTASKDALEHPQGFLSAVSPEGEVDRETPPEGLGTEWKIVKYRLGIKKYPACYCTHRALDAMLELLARHPLKPAEIARITVSVSDTHALILRNHQPQTGLAAKFSMEFAMAAAVIARRAGLAEYTDGFVRRPEVQDLMRRVAIETNRNYDPEVSGASVFDQVRVDLIGGGVVESEKVARAKGHADRPLSEDELFEKFRICLDAGGARIAPDVLFDRLRHLEDLSARELTAV